MSRRKIAVKPAKRRKSKKKARKKPGLMDRLPEGLQIFLYNRFYDTLSLALCAFGAALTLALYSYHPDDPSLNTATTQDPQNILGAAGSYTADLLLQTLGLAALAIALWSVIWGVRIFQRQIISHIWLRLTALPIAVLCLATAFARLPAPQNWLMDTSYLGGSAGALIFNTYTGWAQSLTGLAWHSAYAVLAGILGLLCLNIACAFRLDEWQRALAFTTDKIYRAGYGIYVLGWRVTDFFYPHEDTDEDEETHSVRQLKIADTEDNVESFAMARMSTAKKPPPKITRKARPKPPKARQAKLALRSSSDRNWEMPPLELLQEPSREERAERLDETALQRNAELLQSVLSDFGVRGDITSVSPGPIVTLYELEPAPGTKSSRVIGLSDDIARSMSAVSVRAAVVPGRNVIGIELPNARKETVYLREILSAPESEHSKAKLPLLLGKNIAGDPVVADLSRMPHLLVAGTTGSGKSVAINTMILSLLYRLPPEKCRFIMIDPKMLELSVYDDIPHLLSPVVTEPEKAIVALKWTVREMEDRYRAMSKLGVRNIEGYNKRLREARENGETLMRKVQTGFDADTGKPVFEDQPLDLTELPYIVVVVDEFADLMIVAGKDVEAAIQRLAQMARAAGIHLIMATQRPSVDVITGTIKANFPTRISFQVTSKIDSRTILGDGGAETLLGHGDMLYMAAGGRLTRVHGPFVDDQEVEQVVSYLRQQGEPDYLDDVTEGTDDMDNFGGIAANDGTGDELYDRAVALIIQERKASTSFVQRHLQIGYNRAARIIEQLEKEGLISAANHVGKREVYVGE